MNRNGLEYIRLIWEMDSNVEEFAIADLTDLGALGFQTLKGNSRDITLHAYFNLLDLNRITRELSTLREQLPGQFRGLCNLPEIQQISSRKWAEEWKQYFKPFHVSSRFMVCPPWDQVAPVSGIDIVVLDPGQAFGTGLHESTKICVQELESRVKTGMRILDVGCGSGILSIVSIFLGSRFCLSLDMDFTACLVTRSNALLNHSQQKIHPLCVNAVQWLPLYSWDLIVANILPHILQQLIRQLIQFRHSGTEVCLSGIPVGEENTLITAIEKSGFGHINIRELDGWLLLRFIA